MYGGGYVGTEEVPGDEQDLEAQVQGQQSVEDLGRLMIVHSASSFCIDLFDRDNPLQYRPIEVNCNWFR
jgi:hypothetical protein